MVNRADACNNRPWGFSEFANLYTQTARYVSSRLLGGIPVLALRDRMEIAYERGKIDLQRMADDMEAEDDGQDSSPNCFKKTSCFGRQILLHRPFLVLDPATAAEILSHQVPGLTWNTAPLSEDVRDLIPYVNAIIVYVTGISITENYLTPIVDTQPPAKADWKRFQQVVDSELFGETVRALHVERPPSPWFLTLLLRSTARTMRLEDVNTQIARVADNLDKAIQENPTQVIFTEQLEVLVHTLKAKTNHQS